MSESLIDWLPKNRVHLLTGSRDAGKTRYVVPAMMELFAVEEWAYVTGDRSRLDAEETIRDMGYEIRDVPLIPAFGAEHKNWVQIAMALATRSPKPKVAVIEGFQRLCANRNKDFYVTEFLNQVDAYTQPSKDFPRGITILGVAECPKQKPHERYQDPSAWVSGSGVWGYATSTVLALGCIAKDWEYLHPARRLWVCRKNKIRLCLQAEFDSRGRLVVSPLEFGNS